MQCLTVPLPTAQPRKSPLTPSRYPLRSFSSGSWQQLAMADVQSSGGADCRSVRPLPRANQLQQLLPEIWENGPAGFALGPSRSVMCGTPFPWPSSEGEPSARQRQPALQHHPSLHHGPVGDLSVGRISLVQDFPKLARAATRMSRAATFETDDKARGASQVPRHTRAFR